MEFEWIATEMKIHLIMLSYFSINRMALEFQMIIYFTCYFYYFLCRCWLKINSKSHFDACFSKISRLTGKRKMLIWFFIVKISIPKNSVRLRSTDFKNISESKEFNWKKKRNWLKTCSLAFFSSKKYCLKKNRHRHSIL